MREATESRWQGKSALHLGTACGLATAAIVWLLGANMQTLGGLGFVATGLLQLFPLAAWGAKTHGLQSRRRAAVAAVAMVTLGEAMLMSNLKVKFFLIALAALGAVAIYARIPRRFFEAKETGSSTFDDTSSG